MALTHHTVSEDDHDIRLDRWFRRHFPGFPHALLEKYLRKGLIRVDGRKAKTSDRIRSGQVVGCPELKIEPRGPKHKASAEDMAEIQKWVLYKDAHVIIINKPASLAVQGGSKVSRSIDDMLDGLVFDGRERPRLVHRLDRDTTGALLLARSAKVAAQLAKGFAGKSIEKTYLALVNGSPLPPKGVVDLPLLKSTRGSDREQVYVDEEEGQAAKTEYRVLDSLAGRLALVELKPLTGRMHQLRVHMAALGCPIVGDHKYGLSRRSSEGAKGGGGMDSTKALGVENILHLHAWRIVVPPVCGGRKIDVKAPLPPHMVNSFKALGIDFKG